MGASSSISQNLLHSKYINTYLEHMLVMASSVKKLAATAFGISFLLVTLLALAPTTYAISPPTCTATTSYTGYTYTLTVAPCTSPGIALNTPVTATLTTNDPTVHYGTFFIFSPTAPSTPAYQSGIVSVVAGTASYGPNTLNVPGMWVVTAEFWSTVSPTIIVLKVDISVSVLVLSELPLGTIAASSIALVGFFTARRLSKNFLKAIPAK
jgi:hypothetical protein